jgi:thiamine-phosphate pyrophosphorylase
MPGWAQGGGKVTQRKGMDNFLAGDIYGITDDALSRGRSSIEFVRLLLAGGVRVIQYREKAKPTRLMYQECLAICDLTRSAGATFIVNDHVDLAMAVGPTASMSARTICRRKGARTCRRIW